MKHLTVLPPAADQSALETQLTRWKKAEEGLEQCTLLARVMQGLCLAELRDLHGNSNRGNPNLRNSPKQLENWADYVKKGWGFSDEKARLLIQLAKAAQPRLRKLAEAAQTGLGAILDKPLSQLTATEYKSLKAVTHKLTDGKTNRMIQEELGLFKGDDKKTRGGARTKATNKPEDNGALPTDAPSGWTQPLWDRYRVLSPEQRTAFDCLYLPVLKLAKDFEEHWAFLPDIERADIDGHLLDMRNRIKAAVSAK